LGRRRPSTLFHSCMFQVLSCIVIMSEAELSEDGTRECSIKGCEQKQQASRCQLHRELHSLCCQRSRLTKNLQLKQPKRISTGRKKRKGKSKGSNTAKREIQAKLKILEQKVAELHTKLQVQRTSDGKAASKSLFCTSTPHVSTAEVLIASFVIITQRRQSCVPANPDWTQMTVRVEKRSLDSYKPFMTRTATVNGKSECRFHLMPHKRKPLLQRGTGAPHMNLESNGGSIEGDQTNRLVCCAEVRSVT
jgi:paraquat-inducible protein B